MRYENWPSHLFETLERYKKEPFQYGSFDCVLWCCFCVEAITGKDLYSDYINQYDTYEQGLELIGCDNISQFFSKHFERVPRNYVQRGDLILLEHEDVLASGVSFGRFHITTGENQGLVRVPFKTIKRAWRVN